MNKACETHHHLMHVKIEKMFVMISQQASGGQCTTFDTPSTTPSTTPIAKTKNIAVLLHTLFAYLCTTLPDTSSQWIVK